MSLSPRRSTRDKPGALRTVIYSHDTYGLGHLRRSLVIAESLIRSHLQAEVMIVTGSPRAQSFDRPERCNLVVLPAILKQPDGSYRSRDLNIPLHELVARRSQTLIDTVRSFQPDMIIVDHAPLGVENELVPLFDILKGMKQPPKLVLGMRDIVDDAQVTLRSWISTGAMDAVRNVYDRIFVYGSTWVPTTAEELRFQDLVDGHGEPKTRHLGYLARPLAHAVKSERYLVTAGGGGDGQNVMRSFLGFLGRHQDQPISVDVVAGPFLSERRFEQVQKAVLRINHDVQLIRFDPHMEERIARARGVIGMAGYNTVTEIMSAGCPALLIPRETPRVEQLLRAQRLSTACGFSWCRAEELDDAVFARFFDDCDRGRRPNPEGIELSGRDRLVEEVTALFSSRTAFQSPSRPAGYRPVKEGA